ncbi:protein NO VEIN domain-containing protein [Micromonospora sp. NPDC005252]|uniref:protein NO VEIN domain-containing protein n=1 Tax=Micromonospora sp. NPDC005252 TaxID=3364228 RepID=UPI0036A2ADDA
MEAAVRLNAWWAGRPHERFWMEITDREVLGQDLTTPQVKDSGKEYWSYSLVSETQPGDIVFHWHDNWAGEPALVGWSEVVGPLAEGEITWQARGTSGRARGVARTMPSWVMPCGGFTEFPRPVTRFMLSRQAPRIRRVRNHLQSEVGRPYFPFIFYRPDEIRAAQAYLVKFPAALVQAIPQLAATFSQTSTAKPGRPSHKVPRQIASRRQQDPKLRAAIERHAVEVAKDHYRSLGATEIIELGKPYDLLVRGLGPDRHVEVKGSAQPAANVELTVNEVTHARGNPHADLVVVDKIAWISQTDGSYETTGGHTRIWENWSPDSAALRPTRYLYELPVEEPSL